MDKILTLLLVPKVNRFSTPFLSKGPLPYRSTYGPPSFPLGTNAYLWVTPTPNDLVVLIPPTLYSDPIRRVRTVLLESPIGLT